MLQNAIFSILPVVGLVKKGVACATVTRWSWAENFFSGPKCKMLSTIKSDWAKKVFSEQP